MHTTTEYAVMQLYTLVAAAPSFSMLLIFCSTPAVAPLPLLLAVIPLFLLAAVLSSHLSHAANVRTRDHLNKQAVTVVAAAVARNARTVFFISSSFCTSMNTAVGRWYC
jgi:glucose-6-phosphate-specific signal transduction histidine kinase